MISDEYCILKQTLYIYLPLIPSLKMALVYNVIVNKKKKGMIR